MLERAIARHGDNAYLLANLARVYAALGDEERADALIWRALELDPNEASFTQLADRATWLRRTGRKRPSRPMRGPRHLPGSWRAQLWLARDALARGDLATATQLYEEALGRASRRPPICSCS